MFRAVVLLFILIGSWGEARAEEPYRFNDSAKAWTSEEKQMIASAFDLLRTIPMGRRLIERVVIEKGPITFYRSSTMKTVPSALAEADVHRAGIVFYDRRFDARKRRVDPVDVQTLTHEITHIFDCLPSNVRNYNCLSGQKPFAKAMKLKKFVEKTEHGKTIMLQPPRYSKAAVATAHINVNALAKTGKLEEAKALYDSYAHAMGVPSLYSFTGTGELLAEVVAATILDAEADRYLPAEVRVWVEGALE